MSKRIQIAGIPIDPVNYEQTVEQIEKWIKGTQRHQLVTVNPEMIMRAQKEPAFKQILLKSSLNTADGTGALWAADYLEEPIKKGLSKWIQLFFSLLGILFKKPFQSIPQRVTGSDLLPKLVAKSHKKGWKLFFLGADEGVARQAKAKLLINYPRAKVVDCFAGSPNHDDALTIIKRINESKADILLVAYGNPKQEEWIYHYLPRLKTIRVAIGVGGSFDFYAHKIKRAPHWARKSGLEWLWRLYKEPTRLPRIWNATVGYVSLIYRLKNSNSKL